MSIKLATAVAAWAGLCFCAAAQEPVPDKKPLAFPIIVAPADNPQAPSLTCVVASGPAVPTSAIAFSPDGKLLAVGGYQEVLLWDLAGATLARRIGVGQIGDVVRAVAFRSNGQWLAAAEGSPYGPGAVRVFDVNSGQQVVAFAEPKDAVLAVAFSPDGRLLAAGGVDGLARIWDAEAQKFISELPGHTDWVLSTAFSADGKFLVTSSADRTARIWETGTWKPVAKFDQTESVNGASFGPGAELAAVAVAGPTERMVRLRRRDNAQLAIAIDLGAAGPLGVLWAPAGNRLYVPLSDDTIRVYDPSNGGHVATLAGHTDWVDGVALSPDGAMLASASADGTVKLWHTGESRLLATLVQVAPRTDEWLVLASPGYLAGSALGAVQFNAANLTMPADQILATVQNAELVKKVLGGEKLPPPAVN